MNQKGFRGKDEKAMFYLCRATAENKPPGDIYSRARRCRDISAPGPNEQRHTPLHFGASFGSLDAMKTLLELGALIDAPARSSATPLHLAVQAGQPDAVRLLVSRSADLEARDWMGKTALHHACDYARMNGFDNTTAFVLIGAGADVHSMDLLWNTPVSLAMRMCNQFLMSFMLEHGSTPRQDVAYLYAAVCAGSKKLNKLLKILVEAGWAPPPSRSSACSSGRGGTTNGTTAWSENDLVGSTRGRNNDAYNDDIDQGEDSLLHEAVMVEDDGGFLAELLSAGEDPNVMDSSGNSPLMVAAYSGSVAKVEALLEAGAALDLRRPQDGFTAVHAAAMRGRVEVTELMLAAALSSSTKSDIFSLFSRDIAPCSSVMQQYGASSSSSSSRTASTNTRETCPPLATVVDVMDDLGRRPLHFAAAYNNVPVMEVLLGAGADIDSRDKRGGTPLFHAAKEDNAEAVIALLKAGASPDLKDSSGHAALHMAVRMPAGTVVGALITAGASPGIGGERGPTPLHVACESNARGTVEALLRAGAVPGHCWNDCLESPLIVACKCGSLNAVKLLLPRLSARQINMRNRSYGSDEGGETPLVAAIMYDCFDESEVIGIVEALLEAGADPTLETSAYMNPLTAVIVGHNTKASPTLGPPLIRALAAAGADVNRMGTLHGFTPLHMACFEGACGEVVQALLDAGADACMPCAGSMWYAGTQFMTSLQLAGATGNVEAVSVLIRHPACGGLNAVGAAPSRATVLACAVQHGQTEVCRFLLELGADMDLLPVNDEKSRDGKRLPPKSLIERAAQLGHLDAMNLLMQAKVFKDQAEEEAEEVRGAAVFGAWRGRVKVS